MSDIGTRMLDKGTQMSDIGTRMSDIGTRMSGIDIGRRIYILDVRYRFRKLRWHFVLNGASYYRGFSLKQLKLVAAIKSSFKVFTIS